MSEAQVEATENGLTHPEHVILTPTRNPSVGERARELLARANEVMASAPRPSLPRSPLPRTRAARRPNEGMACPATGAEMAPSASEDAAEDVSESCTICMSSPRAVRFLPCRHAVMCEVCAMTEMERTGMCSHCRQPVEGLVFVPVTPLRPKRLTTHQDEPEPEGLYQSKEEFLQQAEAAPTLNPDPDPNPSPSPSPTPNPTQAAALALAKLAEVKVTHTGAATDLDRDISAIKAAIEAARAKGVNADAIAAGEGKLKELLDEQQRRVEEEQRRKEEERRLAQLKESKVTLTLTL